MTFIIIACLALAALICMAAAFGLVERWPRWSLAFTFAAITLAAAAIWAASAAIGG